MDRIGEIEKEAFPPVDLRKQRKQRKQRIAEKLLEYALDKMREYGMESACLTCKKHLIHYYVKFRFVKIYVSEYVHGGAVWYDMVCKLKLTVVN